jgi:predicted lipoprotein with Yx(FWY)xxD motif
MGCRSGIEIAQSGSNDLAPGFVHRGMKTKSTLHRFRLTPAMALIATAGAAAGLIACGSSSGSNSATAASAAAAPKVVSVKTVKGVRVFVNAKGKTLYSPNQERTGMVSCTGPCAKIWVPVTFGGNAAQLRMIHAGLGLVRRPGGAKQVAFHSRPLYSFSPESAGMLTGDGVRDQFGQKHFTWHVVKLSGGTGTSTTPPPTTGGGGYGY